MNLACRSLRTLEDTPTDQGTLRNLIEAKLADGRLPHDSIPRIWGGPGNDEVCNACDEAITKSQFVMEGLSTQEGGVQFHVQCFYLWDTVRKVLGHEPSGPA